MHNFICYSKLHFITYYSINLKIYLFIFLWWFRLFTCISTFQARKKAAIATVFNKDEICSYANVNVNQRPRHIKLTLWRWRFHTFINNNIQQPTANSKHPTAKAKNTRAMHKWHSQNGWAIRANRNRTNTVF